MISGRRCEPITTRQLYATSAERAKGASDARARAVHVVAGLAARQKGVVSRVQLNAAGVLRGVITRLIRVESDRNRDMTLTDAGYHVTRVTWRQFTEEPLALIAHIARVLDRRSRMPH